MYRKSEDIGFMLKVLNGVLERRFNQELQKDGLTVSQMHVLGYLHRNEKKTVTQKDIEDYLEVSHPTTVGILKRLEAKGFVSTSMQKDRRFMKIVCLTEKGEKLSRKIKDRHVSAEKKMSKGFSGEEILQLKSYMRRLAENMSDEMPEDLCASAIFRKPEDHGGKR